MVDMIDGLIDFIRDSRVILLSYKGFDYVFEPYLIYRGKNGVVYIHGWKISGGGIRTEESHWCNLIVNEISNLQAVGRFKAPYEGFNPRSRMFHEIIFSWDRRID